MISHQLFDVKLIVITRRSIHFIYLTFDFLKIYVRREISKFKLYDKLYNMNVCAYNINRTFLYNTFKLI